MRVKSYKVLHWLNTGIFPATVMFSCGFSYEEIVTLLKRKKAHDWLAGISNDDGKGLIKESYMAALQRKENGKNLYYIHLRDTFDFSDKQMIALAHECLHICQFVLPAFLDRDSEIEAEAYLHTHLMTQCLKILRGEK